MHCKRAAVFAFKFAMVAAIFLTLSGCQIFTAGQHTHHAPISSGQPVDYFLPHYFFDLKPSRVVLMIPKMRNDGYEVQTKFADAVHRQLNEKGIFEVVVKAGFCDVDMDSIRQGTFDERAMLEIVRRFSADGILFCEVTNFSAYEPLQMGNALTFIDMRESIVTLHTNGFWNSADPNIAQKFRQEVCKIYKCKAHTADVYLRSPSEFIEFVARDLTQFLQERIYHGLNSNGAIALSQRHH